MLVYQRVLWFTAIYMGFWLVIMSFSTLSGLKDLQILPSASFGLLSNLQLSFKFWFFQGSSPTILWSTAIFKGYLPQKTVAQGVKIPFNSVSRFLLKVGGWNFSPKLCVASSSCLYLGLSINGGSPVAGWYITEKPIKYWMIKWGTPIFGNLQLYSLQIDTTSLIGA